MKTKTLLQTTGLAVAMIGLTILYSNAQIPFEGLQADHEGIAVWDADGTGPEPAAVGHPHPFGYGGSRYYSASRDYDDIDPNPDAALCHALAGMTGFPLFEQALTSHGYSPGQVKIKQGLMSGGNDIEGEDWFTFSNKHFFNKYDSYCFIELDGEPMILFYSKNVFTTYDQSISGIWQFETSFARPFDHSQNSSDPVKAVAAAFLQDMDGWELRTVGELTSTGVFFGGNGRIDGLYFEMVEGYLEKGLPELLYTGLASSHEGLAGWNADGSGPEPAATGHSFTYNGILYEYSYYWASRDYDDIDNDPNAALCHIIDGQIGFPNFETQMAYRGYTLDQMKVKSSISTLGNDEEGFDWWLNGGIHTWMSYGCTVTFEIAGEPILEYVIDTNFSTQDLDNLAEDWSSYTTNAGVVDISASASSNAKYVAASFLKDLGGHAIKSYMEGHYSGSFPPANGREGVFQEISNGSTTAKLPEGTLIWDHEVSGTWYLANSPYIVMGYIIIPDGETLVIEPGVEVKFNSTERFDIQGCLHAEGTEELPILFTANDPDVMWGGMIWDETPVTNPASVLKHCIFEYSFAYGTEPGGNCGGAIRTNIDENIEISHCIFRYNRADKFTMNNPAGGAIALFESSIHISHCIFHDNSSSWGGAIIIGSNSEPVIDNCLFYDNESTYVGGGGGAGLSWEESSPHFVNCTFADNHSVSEGGAYELEFGGTTTFTNCIFWGNTADIEANQISILAQNPLPVLNVYYCDVEDGLNGITPGFQGDTVNLMNIDPEFITLGDYAYVQDTISSPCRNVGTLTSQYLPSGWTCPAYCLCGNTRILGIIDMGCYESPYITGITANSNVENSSLNVFPNPVNSNPTIEFYLDNEMPVQVSISDIHGRVVKKSETSRLKAGKNQISFSVENLSAGVYFCQLLAGNKMATRKVIKLE